MKHLIEKRNDSLARIEEILALVEAEQRPMTEEEMAEIEALKTEVEEINKQKEVVESTRNLKPVKEENKKDEVKEIMERNLEVRAQEERAFIEALQEGNTRSLGSANKAIIPNTIADRIIEKVVELSDVISHAEVVRYTGDYTIVCESEGTQGADYFNGNFAELVSQVTTEVLGGHTIGGVEKISNDTINSTTIDVVEYVVNKIARKIAEKVEKEILDGTEGKIKGLSKVTNKIEVTGEVTPETLIDMQNQLRGAKPSECMFVVNRATFGALRKAKDATGRFYMENSMGIDGELVSSMFGSRVVVSDVTTRPVAYIAKGAVTVKFAQELNIQILKELYATQNCIGVLGSISVDACANSNDKVVIATTAPLMRARK